MRDFLPGHSFCSSLVTASCNCSRTSAAAWTRLRTHQGTPLYRDPASGHGLLVEFPTNTLWGYDPARQTWTKLRPEGGGMPEGNKRLAYFDPAHNVFVVIHGTTVWAYRYRAP